MPLPAVVLNLLFFPAFIAGNALLFWAFRTTKRDGTWPTERFFCFRRRRPFEIFNVVQRLRVAANDMSNESNARRSKRLLIAICFGYGLCLFAVLTLIGFAPWLFSQLN